MKNQERIKNEYSENFENNDLDDIINIFDLPKLFDME